MGPRSANNITAGAQRRCAGFTLVELMIAVVIAAILAAIAIPSFLDSVRKSRRAEAASALVAVQQAQERWRANNPAYASNTQLTLGVSASPPGLGIASTTPGGYYGLAISGDSATGYIATATAASGKSQASDGDCVQMRVRVAGGNVFYGSAAAGSTDFNESSGNRCWVR